MTVCNGLIAAPNKNKSTELHKASDVKSLYIVIFKEVFDYHYTKTISKHGKVNPKIYTDLCRMKKMLTTEESYRQRIELVMQYIKENIDKEIDIPTLSAVFGFSPFHFHRIIKAYTGESIGAFVVRQRVETAAKLLLYSNMSISDIAYKIGYNVPTSLNKAFVKHYGISPTQYRRSRKPTIEKSTVYNKHVGIEKYSVIELPTTNIIYVGSRGSYQNRDYHATYQKLLDELSIQNKLTDTIRYLGIFYNDTNVTCENNLYSEICIATEQVVAPNGNIEAKQLASGKYIVFPFYDKLSKLDDAYNRIYCEILANEAFTIRDSYGFERYADTLENVKPNSKIKIEIHIPID